MQPEPALTTTSPMGDAASLTIKQRTRIAHQALEASYWMRRLMSNDLTLEEYQQVLARWEHWIQINLRSITESVAELSPPDMPMRIERFHFIQADIKELARLNANTTRPFSQTEYSALSFTHPAQALGACYVLEGSTLGAAVITQHLKRHFGAQIPCRFYSGYGVQTPRAWQGFLAHFNQCIESDALLGKATEGANAVFLSLHTCFHQE